MNFNPSKWKGKKRSREQKLRMMLKASKTNSTDKYAAGGTEKKMRFKPRPVTLPPTPWDKKEEE